MKTETLKILEGQLTFYKKLIKDYEGSLKVGKEGHRIEPKQFTLEMLNTLLDRLSEFNNSKRKIVECIAWVKSIQKADIK